MSDHDRDPDGVNPEPVRETERTTVVQTESGRGGGVLIAVILMIAVLALLFFLFGGNLTGGDGDDVNVSVVAPEMKLPDVDVKLPDVDVKVPDVDVPDVDVDVDAENKY